MAKGIRLTTLADIEAAELAKAKAAIATRLAKAQAAQAKKSGKAVENETTVKVSFTVSGREACEIVKRNLTKYPDYHLNASAMFANVFSLHCLSDANDKTVYAKGLPKFIKMDKLNGPVVPQAPIAPTNVNDATRVLRDMLTNMGLSQTTIDQMIATAQATSTLPK